MPPSAPSRRPAPAPVRAVAVEERPFDLWDDAEPAAAPAAAAAAAAAKRQRPPRSKAVPAPGVEVCHAGASYNPSAEAHQELLGAAVAVEHMKALRAELHPIKPPGSLIQSFSYQLAGYLLPCFAAMGARVAEHLMREMLYAQEEPAGEDAPRLTAGGEESDGEGAAAALKRAQKRKLTKTDRNRRLRARATEDAQAQARALKKQRRDINELAVRFCRLFGPVLLPLTHSVRPQPLAKEVSAEAEAASARAARRSAAAAHRSASGPSRLGKRRFVAEPIAVQLSEEVTGSLRQLAPVPTLLRDRYKSLQRRELVEPRAPAAYKRSRSYLQYEPGARGTRENEMHAETVAQKAAARSAKAGGVEE